MTKRANRILLAAFLWLVPWCCQTLAQENPSPQPPGAAVEEEPSPELLEFLADWETSQNEWVGPEDMETLPLPEQESEYDNR